MEVSANLSAGFSIGDVEKVIGDAVNSSRPPKPLRLSKVSTATSPGSVPITLDLGSPPVGSIWQVRVVTLYGNDDHTTVASLVAAFYTSDPANLSLAGLRLPGLAIPSATIISDTAIWCYPNENLVVATSGNVAAGQQIGCNITVEEWKMSEILRMAGY